MDNEAVIAAAREAGWSFGTTMCAGVKCWQFRRTANLSDARYPAFPDRDHAINHKRDELRRAGTFDPTSP